MELERTVTEKNSAVRIRKYRGIELATSRADWATFLASYTEKKRLCR